MAPLEISYDGYWGKPTATIDWCEANYEVTHYIAEFWNTISNFVMIVPPLIGAIQSKQDGLEDQYFFSYLWLMFVGIGSWCFHGTLLYSMQLMDELPMIWGSAVLIYAFVEIDVPRKKKNYGLMLALFLYCFIVTAVYLTIKQPVFHEVAYGLMVFTLVVSSARTARKYKSSLIFLVLSGVLYGTGFIIWNLDNVFCSQIRTWSRITYQLDQTRNSVGYPMKPLLQGHAWWHIFTGSGAYLSILFSVDARCRFLKDEVSHESLFWLLPVVRRRSSRVKKDSKCD